ncbi:hypothetical protein U2F26_13760 [Micromonospora sp. 4G57]|uniref:Type II toxin-antitoxin system HicB family antitoxin n=1 Tax=Micromonospora sicca TaxID=2202420 RepID=A0ABU5JAT0_9ACTN|nr:MULTISPECIES: hypothetical protein [unclassified Micromonospora]MDZ5443790.1 hypothetical protein [Micromonospora sp. 4G57]MDZ5489692.1 hypothetical protein [Micromonospora sp. 4G53]
MTETNPRVYHVVVTRSGGDLCADVPELPGVHTFAKDEATLDVYVREAIALFLDLPMGGEAALRVVYSQASDGTDE